MWWRGVMNGSIKLLIKANEYVSHEVMESDINNGLEGKRGYGALVFWTPSGGGKTTTLRHIVNNKKKGIYLTASQEISDSESLSNWLKAKLKIYTNTNIAHFFPGNHTCNHTSYIIIDNFDAFQFHPGVKEFVRSYANDSYKLLEKFFYENDLPLEA